jgi:hypothetical protein
LRRIQSIGLLCLTLCSAACAQNPPQPVQHNDAPVIPATAPATLPATNPADVAAVREALSKYNAAIDSGDVETAAAGIHTSSPAHLALVDLLKRGTAAGRGVYDATVTHFGAAELEKAGISKLQFASLFTPVPVEQLNVKVDGDKAVLSVGETDTAAPGPTMIKTAGVWKLDATGLFPPVTEQQVKDQSAIFDAIISAFNKTRDDVAAGKIAAPDEVVVLMNHRAERAAREAQMKQIPADLLTPPAAEDSATEPMTESTTQPAAPTN